MCILYGPAARLSPWCFDLTLTMKILNSFSLAASRSPLPCLWAMCVRGIRFVRPSVRVCMRVLVRARCAGGRVRVLQGVWVSFCISYTTSNGTQCCTMRRMLQCERGDKLRAVHNSAQAHATPQSCPRPWWALGSFDDQESARASRADQQARHVTRTF